MKKKRRKQRRKKKERKKSTLLHLTGQKLALQANYSIMINGGLHRPNLGGEPTI
jgi:hypothetical protein